MVWQEVVVWYCMFVLVVGVCFIKKIQVIVLSIMVWWDDIGWDRVDWIIIINGMRMVMVLKKIKIE